MLNHLFRLFDILRNLLADDFYLLLLLLDLRFALFAARLLLLILIPPFQRFPLAFERGGYRVYDVKSLTSLP